MTRTLAILLALSGPALAADNTPFFRMGDPFPLPATTTPAQFAIDQPAGSTSYRFVNKCFVDVRIKTVPSMTTSVTATTGTLFLARTAEIVASSPPLSSPRIVSVMTLGDPGPAGCQPELFYGTGQ